MMEKSQIINIAKNIGEKTKAIVNLENVVVDEAFLPMEQENEIKETPSIMESALSSKFNSPEELKAKKVLSAALLIAKKKKVLPVGVPASIDAIGAASTSDETVTKMKAAYQVATGKIDPYKATDLIIDRATSRMIAVSDVVVKKVVDVAIDRVGEVVATAFPPARPVVAVLKVVKPFVTKKVQQLVKKGIKKLGAIAKATVRKIGSKLFSKVKSGLAKLFS